MADRSPDPMIPAVFVPVAINLADEGIPVAVIARSLRQASDDIRLTLREAIDAGTLVEMPRDDWPATSRRADRLPQETRALGDEHLAVGCIRVFKLTPLQADVFALLLKRNEAYKTSIHAVIEGRRLRRQNKPSNMEETELKMVDVIICNLRKKLKKHNVKIKTLWGKGYCMDKADRDRALTLLSDYHKTQTGDTNGVEAGDSQPDTAGDAE